MPFKSQAQRRKFAQLLVEGKISPQTFEEWNRETGSADLPERAPRKRARKKAAANKAPARARKKTAKTSRKTTARRSKRAAKRSPAR